MGIGLLVVVLAGLFLLGCWYLKKRSGYKIIRVRTPLFTSIILLSYLHSPCGNISYVFTIFLCLILATPHIFSLHLQNTGSGSAAFTAGHYSEAGTSADNKMAFVDFGSLRSVVRDEYLYYALYGLFTHTYMCVCMYLRKKQTKNKQLINPQSSENSRTCKADAMQWMPEGD